MRKIITIAFFVNMFVCITANATTTKSLSIPKAGLTDSEIDTKINTKLANYAKTDDLDDYAKKTELSDSVANVISENEEIVTALKNNSHFNTAVREAVQNNVATKDDLPDNIKKLNITSDGKIDITSVYNLQDTLNSISANAGGGTASLSQEQLDTLNTAIAEKAKTSYVDTELAKKANITDMNTALALKADKTYVDTAVQNAGGDVDLSSYAKTSDLSDFVTSESVANSVNEAVAGAMKTKFYADDDTSSEKGNLKSEFLPINIEQLPTVVDKMDLTKVATNEVANTTDFENDGVYVWVYNPQTKQMGWAKMDSSTISFLSK